MDFFGLSQFHGYGSVCEVALSVGGLVPGKFLGIVGQDPSDS